MKVCKYCGCEYYGLEDRYEPTNGLTVKVISPSWIINVIAPVYPITPIIPIMNRNCPCPCHWHPRREQAYIEACREIHGLKMEVDNE